MRDVAIVSYAESQRDLPVGQTETLMLLPVVAEALARSGIARKLERLMSSAERWGTEIEPALSRLLSDDDAQVRRLARRAMDRTSP